MRFLRGLWRFLIGLKDALALILLLLIFTVIWAGTRGAAPMRVPSNAALVLDLDGYIVDQPVERSPVDFVNGREVIPEVRSRDIVEAIERAARDDRIKVLVLELDNFYGAGAANLQSIGTALKQFRASGKPIRAFSTAYLDDGYYLAAHANEVWLDPLGAVLLTGPGGSTPYFKQALDKLGVNVNVFRVGTYKSFVEPFTRTEASPEAKAANQALVDTVWDNYVTDVQAVRPRVKIDATLADLPNRIRAAGGDLSAQALKDGFVDRIGTQVALGREMNKLVGKGTDRRPGSYNGIGFRDYLRGSSSPRNTSGGAVGVVYVAGDIVDGEAPPGTAGGDTISDLIAEAAQNSDLKALVVRVDSPGGSVLASEKIRDAIAEAKATRNIPVVASFGDVAASGGYWVSTAADAVFAQPSTITGSIGVFAIIPSFERTLGKLGISADTVKSTPYSGEPDVLRGLTPDTAAILQASVEDIYRRFLGLVAGARHLPATRVDQMAQGRVWAGGTAQQLGLVDRLGGLDAAIEDAARRAKLDPEKARVVNIEAKPSLPFQILSQFFAPGDNGGGGDAFARLARGGQLRLVAALTDAVAVADGATIQARCLACAGHLPPRVAARTPHLAELLAALR